MLDRQSTTVKGGGEHRVHREGALRVLAFTGLWLGELLRNRPEHSSRSTQTLVVYTGKGGRTRTFRLSAPAAEALADLEAVGAIGPFSASTVRRAFVQAAARRTWRRSRTSRGCGASSLAIVSHELRAPPASIIDSVTTLLRASPGLDPAEMREFFRIINDQLPQQAAEPLLVGKSRPRRCVGLFDDGRLHRGRLDQPAMDFGSPRSLAYQPVEEVCWLSPAVQAAWR